MFRRLSEPLPLSEASLLALCPALNSPVLHWGGRPYGPASAAVVVFAEDRGGLGAALGIRSLETGAVVMFRNRAFPDAQASVESVMASAVDEAERLGFLFDVDIVSSAREGEGRARAAALWVGLVEPSTEMPFPGVSAGAENAGQPIQAPGAEHSTRAVASSELLLEEVAEGELPEISLEAVVAAPSSPPTTAQTEACGPGAEDLPACGPSSLSKFRAAESGEREADPANRLGRIPLVRVLRAPPAVRRLPYLARLLSSF
jgi:hypothetical protein